MIDSLFTGKVLGCTNGRHLACPTLTAGVRVSDAQARTTA